MPGRGCSGSQRPADSARLVKLSSSRPRGSQSQEETPGSVLLRAHCQMKRQPCITLQSQQVQLDLHLLFCASIPAGCLRHFLSRGPHLSCLLSSPCFMGCSSFCFYQPACSVPSVHPQALKLSNVSMSLPIKVQIIFSLTFIFKPIRLLSSPGPR